MNKAADYATLRIIQANRNVSPFRKGLTSTRLYQSCKSTPNPLGYGSRGNRDGLLAEDGRGTLAVTLRHLPTRKPPHQDAPFHSPVFREACTACGSFFLHESHISSSSSLVTQAL